MAQTILRIFTPTLSPISGSINNSNLNVIVKHMHSYGNKKFRQYNFMVGNTHTVKFFVHLIPQSGKANYLSDQRTKKKKKQQQKRAERKLHKSTID